VKEFNGIDPLADLAEVLVVRLYLTKKRIAATISKANAIPENVQKADDD
jgi:hypothetical protein